MYTLPLSTFVMKMILTIGRIRYKIKPNLPGNISNGAKIGKSHGGLKMYE